MSVLGNVQDADRLEKIAFNALPAACSADYWEHQYDEQANQIACVYEPNPIFTTNHSGIANLFGLEPQYGCCTANYHQGWPKFVSHLWMATPDGGLAAVAYAPSAVETQISGESVKVELATEYPFSQDLTFKVTVKRPLEFPLYLRVPEWAEGATLALPDGTQKKLEAGTFQKVSRLWNGNEKLQLHLPMAFKVKRWFHDAVSVEKGPLVFSLGLREIWKPARPFPFQPKGNPKNEYFVIPQDNWNYALALDPSHPDQSLTLKDGVLKGNPFTLEGAPLQVTVKGSRLADWAFAAGAAETPPQSPVVSNEPLEDLTLVPYGSTRLRVTVFPLLKN